jgi:hypothetical protein
VAARVDRFNYDSILNEWGVFNNEFHNVEHWLPAS